MLQDCRKNLSSKRHPGAALILAAITICPAVMGEVLDLPLSWDPPAVEDNIAGYKVYYYDGQSLRVSDVGLTFDYVLQGIDDRNSSLIYATAYDSEGRESPASTIVKFPPSAACQFFLDPPYPSLGAWRDTNTVFVATSADCPVNVDTTTSWLHLVGMTAAGGRTAVRYVSESNQSTQTRQGFLKINGQFLTVPQVGVGILPPIIIRHLVSSRTVSEGGALELSVEVESEEGVTFQWYQDATPIQGANKATLIKSEMTAGDVGRYSVAVQNSVGSFLEGPVDVKIYQKPRIVPGGDLKTQFVVVGDGAFFFVVAFGPELHYVWKKDGAVIPATDSSILIFPAVRHEDLGTYQVVISNPAGTVESSLAFLTSEQFERELGRLHVVLSPGKTLSVEGEGVPGESYLIQTSHDLVDWHQIDSVIVDDGGLFRVDTPSPADSGNIPWFVRTIRQIPATSSQSAQR